MTSRRVRRAAFLALGLLLATIAVLWFVRMDDACMNGSGGSCPTLADVNGVRYTVSVAHPLIDIVSNLTPYAPITRTNAPDHFAELTTFQIRGIDPTAVLVAPAHAVTLTDVGPYRLLYGPNSELAYPALCDLIPVELRFGDRRCGAPA